jgi:spermidine/putrescine transport system ATP-binding protein
MPAFRRPVSTVFQHYALFPHLDVFENVAFGLRERKTPRAEIERRVAEMLSLVDLEGRERARPKQLSGGQQQRVALARSLVLEPEVLLLDEPLGALDLKLRKQMQSLLKRVQREVGITFIYVTHDQEEAFSMSDRVGIMQAGLLEQVGRPQEVYQRPRTLFVAEFVGASNRFLGVVRGSGAGGAYVVEIEDVGTAEIPGAAGLVPGDHVIALVRPEAITLDDVEGACIRGRITDIAYLGPQVIFSVAIPSGGLLTVTAAGRNDVVLPPVGAEARFGWAWSSGWVLAA